MKNLKKLFNVITLVVIMALTFTFTVGCNNQPEEQWNGRTFEITVCLEDGETPVKNIRLALCYNTDTSSLCLNPVKTDDNGKVTITVPETVTFVGNTVLHFYNLNDLPEGYSLPSNMTSITMTGGAIYEHAIELTSKTTKLVLTKN